MIVERCKNLGLQGEPRCRKIMEVVNHLRVTVFTAQRLWPGLQEFLQVMTSSSWHMTEVICHDRTFCLLKKATKCSQNYTEKKQNVSYEVNIPNTCAFIWFL